MKDSQQVNQIIQILEGIKQQGSMSDVAKDMFVSQPSISKRVRDIEQMYAVKIVNRTAHPLRLTLAGEYYLTKLKELSQFYGDLHHSMVSFSNNDYREISLGINPTLSRQLLPRILPKYYQMNPHIQIKIDEDVSKNLYKKVLNKSLDVYMGTLTTQHQLDAHLLYEDGAALVMPRSYLGQGVVSDKPLINVGALIDKQPFLKFTADSGFQKIVDNYLFRNNIKPNVTMQNLKMHTALDLAVAGIGSVIIPNYLINRQLIENPNVLIQSIDLSAMSYQIFIASNRSVELNDDVKSLINLAISEFR